MQRHRADDPAFTALLRGLEAKQTNMIAPVHVESHMGAGQIPARIGISVIASDIPDVAQQMPLGVLRDDSPEMSADAPIGDGRLF